MITCVALQERKKTPRLREFLFETNESEARRRRRSRRRHRRQSAKDEWSQELSKETREKK